MDFAIALQRSGNFRRSSMVALGSAMLVQRRALHNSSFTIWPRRRFDTMFKACNLRIPRGTSQVKEFDSCMLQGSKGDSTLGKVEEEYSKPDEDC